MLSTSRAGLVAKRIARRVGSTLPSNIAHRPRDRLRFAPSCPARLTTRLSMQRAVNAIKGSQCTARPGHTRPGESGQTCTATLRSEPTPGHAATAAVFWAMLQSPDTAWTHAWTGCWANKTRNGTFLQAWHCSAIRVAGNAAFFSASPARERTNLSV